MFRIPAFAMTISLTSALPARRAGSTLTEVFSAAGADAAAAGFVMAQLGHGNGAVLWIQDRLAQRETGRPCLAGLGLHRPLMLMQLSRPVDVMMAVEEGLRCKVLGAVIAEIRGNPPAANFTVTKRLALRAEATGVPCWLIRQAATTDLSAARDRWRIATLPSAANPDDPRAPGDPRWRVELFRSRDRQPGRWVARHERATTKGAAGRLDMVSAASHGAVAEDPDSGRQRAAR
jgi:protein ImuA